MDRRGFGLHRAAAAGLAFLIGILASAAPPDEGRAPPVAEIEVMQEAVGEPVPDRLRMRQEVEALEDGGLGESIRHERLSTVRVGEAAVRAVAQLDDASFEARQAASRALMDSSIGDDEIWAILDREGLSQEARQRLLEASCRRILERPRGALGIRMGNAAPPRRGVLVQSTVPGLPADGVLRPGDVIHAVDGKAVATSNDLAAVLQARLPGQEIRLEVMRQERDAVGRPLQDPKGQPVQRELELRLPLGDFAQLERPVPGEPAGGFNPAAEVARRRRLVQVAILQARFGRSWSEVVAPSALEPTATAR